MIAINWFLDVLKNKYVKFDGRAERPEYWFFVLIVVVIGFILTVIDRMVLGLEMPILSGIFYLGKH